MLVLYDQAKHAIENREGEHSKSDMNQNKENEKADTQESASHGNLIGEELNRELKQPARLSLALSVIQLNASHTSFVTFHHSLS